MDGPALLAGHRCAFFPGKQGGSVTLPAVVMEFEGTMRDSAGIPGLFAGWAGPGHQTLVTVPAAAAEI